MTLFRTLDDRSSTYLAILLLLLVPGIYSGVRAQAIPVAVTIDLSVTHPISPLIYGVNAYVYDDEWQSIGDWKVGADNLPADIDITNRRMGGNTMTSYNWENGFCNSGEPTHDNNDFQSFISGAGSTPYAPGAALIAFHTLSQQLGAYSLLELPCAGYVSNDGNGVVSQAESAPSSRWDALSFAKPGAPASYTAAPDLNDGKVYVDEELNFLLQKFGTSTHSGVSAYELDNEPGLWHTYPDNNGTSGTHPRLHSEIATCQDLLTKNITLAAMVKSQDPSAEVYGPAMWGYPEYYSFWSVYNGASHQPADWSQFNVEPYKTNNTGDEYRYNHMTWVNAYLANMKNASAAAGKRLLDVFSIHYYAIDAETPASRVQAPRSLWDPTYVENSYVTQDGNGFTDGRGIDLIPKLTLAINDFYPDTKLGITEWDFGGRHDISGGIAQADALGIFGANGVYAANYFNPVDDYIAAAFRIYRNYDGANSAFGSTGLQVSGDDPSLSSTYASLDDKGRLHIVFINKSLTSSENVVMALNGAANYDRVEAFVLSGSGSQIQKNGAQPIVLPSIQYTAPAASVTHLVLSSSAAVVEEADHRMTDHPRACTLSQNPASSFVTVRMRATAADDQSSEGPGMTELPKSNACSVVLCDALGRTIEWEQGRAPVNGELIVPIDVRTIASGTYRLIVNAFGRTEQKNLVVVH